MQLLDNRYNIDKDTLFCYRHVYAIVFMSGFMTNSVVFVLK